MKDKLKKYLQHISQIFSIFNNKIFYKSIDNSNILQQKIGKETNIIYEL